MREVMIGKALLRSALAIACGAVAACDFKDENVRTVIASNSEWKVTAIGNLDPPSGFNTHFVDFEVERFGSRYARGALFTMGSHDDGFVDDYPQVTWVHPNVVTFTRHRAGYGLCKSKSETKLQRR